jgi:hypothetical protein
MKCSVCNNNFIVSRDQADYINKKAKMEEELCKFIDENIDNGEEACWLRVFNSDALLLRPNQQLRFCSAEVCGAIICNYCFNKNKLDSCPVCLMKK